MDMQEPLCWAEAHHLADIRHWLEACKVAGGGEDVVIIDDTVPKVGSLKTSHFAALTTSRSGLSFKPSGAQGGEQLCCSLKAPSLLPCSTPDLKASFSGKPSDPPGGGQRRRHRLQRRHPRQGGQLRCFAPAALLISKPASLTTAWRQAGRRTAVLEF